MGRLSRSGRALYWSFQVDDRAKTLEFFTRVLGMQILRYREDALSGDDNDSQSRWSCTRVGYGSEESHFVFELVHFRGREQRQHVTRSGWISIRSTKVLQRAKDAKYPFEKLAQRENSDIVVRSPEGYLFRIYDGDCEADPVLEIGLHVSSLDSSLEYWAALLGMPVLSRGGSCSVLKYGPGQCRLALWEVENQDNVVTDDEHLGFSCPEEQLLRIVESMKAAGEQFLRERVVMRTWHPILQVLLVDPDGHQLAFFGEEGLRKSYQDNAQEPFLLKLGPLIERRNSDSEELATSGGKK